MNKYRIRFNKSRGQPGRGTADHVWRVFEETSSGDKEYLFKNFILHVPSNSEKQSGSEDWNVCCYGTLEIDRETSTATIK
jgi:hypothetical protein